MKRAKLVKKKQNIITKADVDQIEAIYKLRPLFASGVYLTPIMQEKSTVIRLTFSEFNFTLQKQVPVTAVLTTLEDLQVIYNAMTQLLQNMREMKRIA